MPHIQTDKNRFWNNKGLFMGKIRKLDPVMLKALEYEAMDLPMGDSRILEVAWQIKNVGDFGTKWYHFGTKAGCGERSLSELRRMLHLLEYWSTALKDIFEIRRGRSITWFPTFEATMTNKEPILTAEDRIKQAFREEAHDKVMEK